MATLSILQVKEMCLIFPFQKSQLYIINCFCVAVMLSFYYADVSFLLTRTSTGFGQDGLHDVGVSRPPHSQLSRFLFLSWWQWPKDMVKGLGSR